MHPIWSDFRRFVWYNISVICIGVLIAELLFRSSAGTRLSALLFSLPVTLLSGFLLASAYYVCRAFPFKKRVFHITFLIFLTSSFVAACVTQGVIHGWNFLLQNLSGNNTGIQISLHLNLIFAISGFVLYLLSLLAYDALIAFDNIREAERRTASALLLARDAELQLLRTQIDPHFLFNSLNSISALTSINPSDARDMTIALAGFFRKTLTLPSQEKITISEELSLCDNFLAVEKIRFGDKLQTQFSFEPSSLEAMVPPMILQPLLENAIKHGIRHLRNGGFIIISGQTQDNWLHLRVENPVTTLAPVHHDQGIGLHNMKQRFAALYGDQASINWERSDSEFIVNIALPLELGHE